MKNDLDNSEVKDGEFVRVRYAGRQMRGVAVALPDAARAKLQELQVARGAAEDVIEVLLWKGAA